MTEARIAPDMATVLTKTGSELAITLQANGKGNFTISNQGRVLGDSADVQKVQSLGSFINDERKAIVKSSVSALAKKTIAAVVLTSRDPAFEGQVPRPVTRIDKSFVDIFRTISAQAEMLNTNVRAINQTEAVGMANELVKNHLLETSNRIRGCFGAYLFYRGGLTEGEEPRKFNDTLFAGNVLGWVYTRLTAQKLQLGSKDFEYRKVYFPKDPTKGLQITFRELKSADLTDNQGGILAGMKTFRGLWSDESVRAICGIPGDWDLAAFDGPAKVLANVPFSVVPALQAVTLEEHYLVLAQHGDRGLPWNVGNTITPQDTLRFLGTIPKRIAYGFIGKPRFSAPWYEILFPGFRFDSAVIERESRSVFGQLLTQFRAGGINSDFFAIARGELGNARAIATIPPLVLAVMDIPADNDLARETIQRTSDGMLAFPNGETAGVLDSWASIMTRREMTDEACANALSGVLATNLEPRSSKDVKKGDIRMARSMLSPQGTSLLREFKRRGYSALATRVDQWLRSFLTSELQAAVAEVVGARLEASLNTPIQFGKGDTVVFIEPTEFAEDDPPADEVSLPDGEDEDNPDDQ
jgi:hypothetical protein